MAALIRDRQLIADVNALETVAVTELDVAPTAFEQVLDLLQEAEFVELTRNPAGEVTGLTEKVPMYRDGLIAIPPRGKPLQHRVGVL
ncbi:hypothetical protein ACIBSS_32680 [Micromonospora aurantiaca]|uniref:hypothetical protein n=1 Tax=Micromonospora aurantiaca (nom. illeg.) TaxID=47850 RepID=UPI000F3E4C99|nr:hypothetical protein [Micromonospora aurantiaca]RNH98239.1 hypothetical protein EEZ25_27125 [Micromonospora aurantiaca]